MKDYWKIDSKSWYYAWIFRNECLMHSSVIITMLRIVIFRSLAVEQLSKKSVPLLCKCYRPAMRARSGRQLSDRLCAEFASNSQTQLSCSFTTWMVLKWIFSPENLGINCMERVGLDVKLRAERVAKRVLEFRRSVSEFPEFAEGPAFCLLSLRSACVRTVRSVNPKLSRLRQLTVWSFFMKFEF